METLFTWDGNPPRPMSTPPPPPPEDVPPPIPPAGSAPVQHSPPMQPMQMGGATAKSGKGKLIGIIAGILIIVAGLIFAGITYGPTLWAKAKGGGDDLSAQDGEGGGLEAGGLPSLTKLQPGSPDTPVTISRNLDGLWYEDGASKPYSGTVVFEEDKQRWEEKFMKGVRTHMRAWDEEGNPVQLHAWNTDGSPKD